MTVPRPYRYAATSDFRSPKISRIDAAIAHPRLLSCAETLNLMSGLCSRLDLPVKPYVVLYTFCCIILAYVHIQIRKFREKEPECEGQDAHAIPRPCKRYPIAILLSSVKRTHIPIHCMRAVIGASFSRRDTQVAEVKLLAT